MLVTRAAASIPWLPAAIPAFAVLTIEVIMSPAPERLAPADPPPPPRDPSNDNWARVVPTAKSATSTNAFMIRNTTLFGLPNCFYTRKTTENPTTCANKPQSLPIGLAIVYYTAFDSIHLNICSSATRGSRQENRCILLRRSSHYILKVTLLCFCVWTSERTICSSAYTYSFLSDDQRKYLLKES